LLFFLARIPLFLLGFWQNRAQNVVFDGEFVWIAGESWLVNTRIVFSQN
jgi:hypothetical protein